MTALMGLVSSYMRAPPDDLSVRRIVNAKHKDLDDLVGRTGLQAAAHLCVADVALAKRRPQGTDLRVSTLNAGVHLHFDGDTRHA